MHTMVQLVIGLASHSKMTIFDEPTNGLDAHARKQFFQALKDSYENDPRYILISSHHIKEIEPLCEKLMIISDRKSTRLNSSHVAISYAVFCLKKKKNYEKCRSN